MKNLLLLKWGTVKGWELHTESARQAAQKWADFGVSPSAMLQVQDDEQKEALCAFIDAVDEIINEWSGETMTKEDAKKYVMGYSR